MFIVQKCKGTFTSSHGSDVHDDLNVDVDVDVKASSSLLSSLFTLTFSGATRDFDTMSNCLSF